MGWGQVLDTLVRFYLWKALLPSYLQAYSIFTIEKRSVCQAAPLKMHSSATFELHFHFSCTNLPIVVCTHFGDLIFFKSPVTSKDHTLRWAAFGLYISTINESVFISRYSVWIILILVWFKPNLSLKVVNNNFMWHMFWNG